MPLRLGIDIACRAAHQVSLADEQGRFIWTGRRFRTTPQDLARLWAMLPDGTDPAEVLVVMEPTRNAWVPLAAWFRRRGADVVLVPPERSADLRRYYAKHTKSDRLDSQLLARLPMLHPDGLYAEQGLGPGDALKRTAKLHSTLTHRRSQSLARLDACAPPNRRWRSGSSVELDPVPRPVCELLRPLRHRPVRRLCLVADERSGFGVAANQQHSGFAVAASQKPSVLLPTLAVVLHSAEWLEPLGSCLVELPVHGACDLTVANL
ncbi:MAG TPA: transposase [Propionibacteriaceae bacterium]